MAKEKPPHGRIFAVPLPDGTYVCGRVLLDIRGCLKRRLFPHDSPLTNLGEAYLIEMYAAITDDPEYIPSEVLIPGAFVESREVGNTWPIVGEEPVDPRTVEFPESIIGFPQNPIGEMAFECGEMRVPLPIPLREQERVDVYKSRHSAFLWPLTCLRVMGRDDEIPENYKIASLEGTDLRISPHRDEIYVHLPFKKEQTYFEKQAQLGLNFERLYE